MRSSLYALAGSAATALAAVRGFNYGAQSQSYETFVEQFTAAKSLSGAETFTSARLYTMIQDSTTDTVISAIPAAIKTNTTLLLGLWASEDQAAFNNELSALKTAISQFGSSGLSDLTVGISVGSEDLYRISETGIKQNSGVGQSPDTLVSYIKQVREVVADTVLANVPIGHVDTWNVYTNTSNSAVITAADFLGLDEYPFYQDGEGNGIENASDLFWKAYENVEAVAEGKPIWITETGWPVSGKSEDEAVPSVENAEKYWQAVACELQARCINTWWYILIDSGASPSFGLTDSLDGTNTQALYSLKCNATSSCSSSSEKAVTGSSSSSASLSTASAGSSLNYGNGTQSGSGSNSVEPTVYVTAVTTSYVTTCPVGHTLTTSGANGPSTTVLTSPSVLTTTGVVSKTVSTRVTLVQSTIVNAVTSSVTKTFSSGATITAPASAGPKTITLYSTDIDTVTSCAASVTNCPARSTVVSSSLIAVGTTVTSVSSGELTTSVLTKETTMVVPVTNQITQTTWVHSNTPVAGAATASGVMPLGTGLSGTGVSGAASGTGVAAKSPEASTLASSWAAKQTPSGAQTASPSSSQYAGAGSKVGGSLALVFGAAAVAML